MMTNIDESTNTIKPDSNKFLVGPGLGLIIMGVAYILWWFAGPWAWEAFFQDPRWAHNWAYAIIIFNVGLAWYHKSAISRMIATIQSFILPITASGSFNTVVLTILSGIIFLIWLIVVIIEKKQKKLFLQDKLSKRAWLWLNMHSIVFPWLLIAHMGLMFFIVRVPLEGQLMSFGIENQAGYLANLPPESLELSTWTFDIGLFIFAAFVLWEQFKMGYNDQNKPWPKLSFFVCMICMAASLIALLIQDITIGFEWVNQVYG